MVDFYGNKNKAAKSAKSARWPKLKNYLLKMVAKCYIKNRWLTYPIFSITKKPMAVGVWSSKADSNTTNYSRQGKKSKGGDKM